MTCASGHHLQNYAHNDQKAEEHRSLIARSWVKPFLESLTPKGLPRLNHPLSLDLKTKGPLHLLTHYVMPSELRASGKKRLVRHLQAAGGLHNVDALANRALAAAAGQIIVAPAERMTAQLIRELAAEALVSRARLFELDRELEALLRRHHRLLAIRLRSSWWRSHRRDAALILSLPGLGTVLTAELIAEAGNLSRFRSADVLASAAGLAQGLRQAGRTRFLRRLHGGNTGLKRVFYQSAFCSLNQDDSRTFYDRKRREGNATTRSSSPSHAAA